MEAKATAKYVRISPRKMRRSVDLIRGRHVDDARRVLTLTQLGPNRTLVKVLDSAVANAEQKNARTRARRCGGSVPGRRAGPPGSAGGPAT